MESTLKFKDIVTDDMHVFEGVCLSISQSSMRAYGFAAVTLKYIVMLQDGEVGEMCTCC